MTTLPEPPDRWDIEQIMTDRVQAVAACGFTERQARFLVTVMLHAGVFVERQYCAFAGITHGQKTHDFVRRLVDGKFARAIATGRLHRGRLIHVQQKRLYGAIGQTDNRHRKPAPLGRLIERVMILDAVLADRRVLWLGAEHDKLSYFRRRVGERLEVAAFPRLVFGEGQTRTVRYFTDKLPIGIRLHEDPIVFLYLLTQPAPFDFRLFLWRHAELLRALPEWTLRLLAPGSLRKALPVYLHAVREECASPLPPSVVQELQWYFHARKDRESVSGQAADVRFTQAMSGFRAPRFRALYGRGNSMAILCSGPSNRTYSATSSRAVWPRLSAWSSPISISISHLWLASHDDERRGQPRGQPQNSRSSPFLVERLRDCDSMHLEPSKRARCTRKLLSASLLASIGETTTGCWAALYAALTAASPS